MDIIAVLASLDFINRIEGVVSSFVYADWRRASQQGIPGFASEITRTVLGANRWTISIPRNGGWSGADIEYFLRRYGVAIWDRGIRGPDYYFCVKERQANWAEYLLLRRGIPISGPLFNPHNLDYGDQHAPGDSPPAWIDRGSTKEDSIDKLAAWL